MVKKQEKFVIIDGNALLHRAYHALPPMTLRDGTLVNAAYGFTSILLKIIKELKPEYICAAFDRKGKSKRTEMFKEYKAQRIKQPDELYLQIPMIEEILGAFKIPVIDAAEEGFEADDVIGTVILKNQQEHPLLKNIIVTGDLDALQLVNHSTEVFTLKKGISDTFTYNEEAVKERYGFGPKNVVDFKALRGDPSDNIPGVKGIGEKTATELIINFGSLEKIYQNIKSEKIRDKTRELLLSQKDEAFLSKELVTINCHLKTNYKLKETQIEGFNHQEVFDLFSKYEFKSLINKIPNALNGEPENQKEMPAEAKSSGLQGSLDFVKIQPKEKDPSLKYNLIKDEKSFKSFLNELKKHKEFAVDSETTSLNVWEAELLGLSFSFRASEAYYLDIKNNRAWLKDLKGVLEDSQIKKIGHNIKYDYEILLGEGIIMQGLSCDTMLAAYLLTSGNRNLDLDSLVFSELGHQMQHIEDLIGSKGKNQLTMDQVEIEKVSWYASEDADFTLKLAKKIIQELEKAGNAGLFNKLEMPLIPVLSDMEQTGIKVDLDFLSELDKKFGHKIKSLSEKIYKLAGTEFNIASPLQLKEILFEKLKIDTQGLKKIKTGLSTAAGELEKLWDRHPIIALISEFREYSKLQNTYTSSLGKEADKQGRIHTSFNQTITATGRISSSNPNLQNIPIRTDLGKELRKAFIAKPGYALISADYSQIELRVIASLANDERMIEYFNNKEDIHTRTAANINKIELSQVTPEQRRAAKEVNFGVIYGLGYVGLAQRTGITREEAKKFIEEYFKLHPQIKDWLTQTKELAAGLGYVETLLGRRRYLPEIHSGVPMIRSSAERMAINAPIQGTAADLLKMAMIKIFEELPKISKETKMLLTVHDELVFEAPHGEVDKVSAFIKETMENIYTLKVPIIVDIGSGNNWGESK